MAPRMRVLFHRCVASCSGEGEREASKGWQETEEKGEREEEEVGEEVEVAAKRGAGRGSGLCKCAHVQISRVECAKVVGR